ncbi:MAG: pantetheine-phosphate adenylyltransferase [Proteobacteria bacterium]|nr:pantetheine-phosphate adenylyltransferase [Pseudomonadota bacterium]
MITAVFPGSFDPLTNGHVDIIERSVKLFDKVIVAVVSNPEKNPLFSIPEREALIRTELKRLGKRVEVRSFSGLLVEFLKQTRSSIVIRGLRAISDYDYETQMALVNKSLWDQVETVFLVAREENSYISSSLVKQVALYGGDVASFVPPHIGKALRQKAKERGGKRKQR